MAGMSQSELELKFRKELGYPIHYDVNYDCYIVGGATGGRSATIERIPEDPAERSRLVRETLRFLHAKHQAKLNEDKEREREQAEREEGRRRDRILANYSAPTTTVRDRDDRPTMTAHAMLEIEIRGWLADVRI